MKPYLVNYTPLTLVDGAIHHEPSEMFRCMADDDEHAIEQCQNAYPDAEVHWAAPQAKCDHSLNTSQAFEIAEMVITAAQDLFEACGAKDDYCIQTIGSVVVFGGTNRVLWRPTTGFRADPSACTPAFYAEFFRRTR